MATCQEDVTTLMQGKINDGLVLLAQKTKSYVDGLNVANRDEVKKQLDDALAPLQDRLNAIDVLNDEDGVNTLLERVNQLQELLSKDGALEDVLKDLSDINSRIDALINRVAKLEDNQKVLQDNQTALQTEQTSQGGRISDLEDCCKAAGDHIDSVESKVDSVIGTDLPKIRTRIKNLEDTINDTEDADGNTVEGLSTTVAKNTAALDTKVSCADLKDAISKIEFAVIATNIDDVFGTNDSGDGEAV